MNRGSLLRGRGTTVAIKFFMKYGSLMVVISTNIAFYFSLFTSFTFVLGAQKNRPLETVPLSTITYVLVEKLENQFSFCSNICGKPSAVNSIRSTHNKICVHDFRHLNSRHF